MGIITSIILLPIIIILGTKFFVSALPTPTWDDLTNSLPDFSSYPPVPAPPSDHNQHFLNVEKPNTADFLPSKFTDTNTAFVTSILASAIASATTNNPDEALDIMFSAQETISKLKFPLELPKGGFRSILQELKRL